MGGVGGELLLSGSDLQDSRWFIACMYLSFWRKMGVDEKLPGLKLKNNKALRMKY